MTLATVLDFFTPDTEAPKRLVVRSIAEIRRDCFTSELRAEFMEADAKARAVEALRKKYELPSQRLAVGLAFYNAKTLDDVPAAARPLLERAALEHDKGAVYDFDRMILAAPLRALRPVRDKILREFNENLAREMDRDAEAFASVMRAAFAPFDCSDDVETGSRDPSYLYGKVALTPLRVLRMWADRSRDFVAQGCPLVCGENEAWLDAQRQLEDVT